MRVSAAIAPIALAVLLAPCAFIAAEGAPAAETSYSHQEYFEHYEGTQTCLACHQQEAESFFHSQHYQWQGEAPRIVNAEGRKLGKLNTLNDFCTNPKASWIGATKNSQGKVIAQGCSKCHAGRGLEPSPTMSPEQLANIDCLICHASGYRRDLYQDEQGRWEWKPILHRNQEGLDSVAKRISQPTRAMCLRCHSGAGGGPNFKRGDIEYALADCDSSFDVHMASAGHDLQCVDCHRGEDHRVRGRGADLSATDLPARPLGCATGECHAAAPHGKPVLDRHASKVDCTACHIPTFAKSDPTDMVRDWSRPFYHQDGDKWSATITLQKDVAPVYAWFDGSTREQFMGEPVVRTSEGAVPVMQPQGSRQDPGAKLHAFKLHRARLPLLQPQQWLIPISVDEFFADGDIDAAVRRAALVNYGIEDARFEWVDTVRWMGLFHEVQPAANALKCADCHGEGGRLDWQGLGYERDPRSGNGASE